MECVGDMRNCCTNVCNELNFYISFSGLQGSLVDIGALFDKKHEYFDIHRM